MASAADTKAISELEGDSPELVAWGLLQWVRRIEVLNERELILSAFQACLVTANKDAAKPLEADAGGATGLHRRLAHRLTLLIAEMEGRDLGQRNQGDRAWILATFQDCMSAVLGKREVVAVPEVVVPVADEVAG